MTYQIFSIVPEYDFRDAIVAHRAVAHPYAFLTEACAYGVARSLSEQGEIEVVVVPFGGSPFRDALYPQTQGNDQDIPF